MVISETINARIPISVKIQVNFLKKFKGDFMRKKNPGGVPEENLWETRDEIPETILKDIILKES